MTVRRSKQIIYGAFYLIVLFGIGTLIRFVWFRPAPPVACTNCIPAGLALAVGNFQTFVTAPGHYTFLARVEDRSSNFAARRFNYSFDLFDASGTVLQSFPNTSFVYAAEAKYLVLPNVAIAVAFDHAGLMIGSTTWVASGTMGLPPQFGNPLAITGSATSSDLITVNSQLTDSDVAAFGPVSLVALFYSDAGTAPIGASQAQLDAIAPGQTEPFAVSYPLAAGAAIDPSLTKVYAYAERP